MKYITTTLIIFSLSLSSLSQINEGELSRVITKYFDIRNLSDIAENSPDIYNKIIYYFKNSFDVQLIGCDSCIIDDDEFFNKDVFDITQFEELREQNSPMEFTYRNKYEITLHSKDEVLNNLGTSVEVLLNYVEPRDFPEWISTGNDEADFKGYKQEVLRWAKDFPMEYRVLTNSSDIRKIRFSRFKTMSNELREHFFNQDGGYLIID